MTPCPGIEPGPHWWEANALTTAPTLLPYFRSFALTISQVEGQTSTAFLFDANSHIGIGSCINVSAIKDLPYEPDS